MKPHQTKLRTMQALSGEIRIPLSILALQRA